MRTVFALCVLWRGVYMSEVIKISGAVNGRMEKAIMPPSTIGVPSLMALPPPRYAGDMAWYATSWWKMGPFMGVF